MEDNAGQDTPLSSEGFEDVTSIPLWIDTDGAPITKEQHQKMVKNLKVGPIPLDIVVTENELDGDAEVEPKVEYF